MLAVISPSHRRILRPQSHSIGCARRYLSAASRIPSKNVPMCGPFSSRQRRRRFQAKEDCCFCRGSVRPTLRRKASFLSSSKAASRAAFVSRPAARYHRSVRLVIHSHPRRVRRSIARCAINLAASEGRSRLDPTSAVERRRPWNGSDLAASETDGDRGLRRYDSVRPALRARIEFLVGEPRLHLGEVGRRRGHTVIFGLTGE